MFKLFKVETHLAEMKTDENRWWRHYIWHWPFGLTLKFDKNEVWALVVTTLYVQISYLCYKKGTQVTHYTIKYTVEGFKMFPVPQEQAVFPDLYTIIHYFMYLRK